MCDVNEKVLAEKVKEINDKGKGKAVGVICDVRDYAQVCAARDKAVEVFGSIDIMANFAGGTARRVLNVGWEDDFPDVPIEVFDWGLDVNLKGPFYFCPCGFKADEGAEQRSEDVLFCLSAAKRSYGKGEYIFRINNIFIVYYWLFCISKTNNYTNFLL